MSINISVRAESRAAKAAKAYNDQVKHGYNPNYVNPKTRRINLSSGKLPPNTRAWEYRVTRRSDGSKFSKSDEVPSTAVNPRASTGFNLPSEGIYDCQLIVTLSNGKKQESAVKSINLRDLLIVIIGDSAASGQGNPDKPGKLNVAKKIEDPLDIPGAIVDAIKDGLSQIAVEQMTSLIAGGHIDPPKMDVEPVWLEKNAHRSLQSGHALAAKQLEDLEAGIVVTLLNFARSGAEIEQGLLKPREDEKRGKNEASWINKNGQIGQLEELRNTVGNRTIDALIISIGGNDLGFAGGVEQMTIDSEVEVGWGLLYRNIDDAEARRKIRKHADDLLDLDDGELTRPGGHFDQLKAQIDKLNVGDVFLVGYPEGFFDKKDGSVGAGCEIFESAVDLDLSLADTRLFKEIAQKLNKTLRTVIAPRYDWHYVDVTAGFVGHGYCSKGGRFFVHCEESLENQGDVDGMLHPNAKGHAIYREQVHKALHRHLILFGGNKHAGGGVLSGDVGTPKGRTGIVVDLVNAGQVFDVDND